MWPVLWLSGLLNFNGPYRGRVLLGSGQERQDHNDDDEEDNKQEEEEAAMLHCSACMEEHFIERLSPTLHKGNLCGEAADSSPCLTVHHRQSLTFNGFYYQ